MAVCLPEFFGRAPVTVGRMFLSYALQRISQMRILFGVSLHVLLMVVPARARQLQNGEDGRKAIVVPGAFGEGDFLCRAHPFWPKKFFNSAISTSFFPKSCSRSRMRPSYS